MRQTAFRLFQAAALAALLPLFAAHALACIALAALPRRGRAAATGELYVVFPYPPGEKSGGSKAIEGLLAALGRGYRLHRVPLYELRPAGGRVRRRLGDWLTHALPMAVQARPFILSPRTVRARIGGPHPVVVEFFSAALFLCFGRRPRGRVVLREHEPLCRRLAGEARAARGVDRLVAALKAGVAWVMMAGVYARVDRVVALTPGDAAFLRRAFPWHARRVACVPVSFDVPATLPVVPEGRGGRELLFVGNFHHRPNVDALRWFLGACAPHLGAGWTLHLCGLDAPLDSAALPPSPVRVVRHGFVGDVDAAFAHVRIAVCPVVSGGGVRMKNLFLAARGKAVATTPLGNEGVGFTPGVEAVVAGDGREMARGILRLDACPAAAAEMGLRAREHVRAAFGHDAVLARFRAEVFAEPPLAPPPGAGAPAALAR